MITWVTTWGRPHADLASIGSIQIKIGYDDHGVPQFHTAMIAIADCRVDFSADGLRFQAFPAEAEAKFEVVAPHASAA